jgi:hypothetical protein
MWLCRGYFWRPFSSAFRLEARSRRCNGRGYCRISHTGSQIPITNLILFSDDQGSLYIGTVLGLGLDRLSLFPVKEVIVHVQYVVNEMKPFYSVRFVGPTLWVRLLET